MNIISRRMNSDECGFLHYIVSFAASPRRNIETISRSFEKEGIKSWTFNKFFGIFDARGEKFIEQRLGDFGREDKSMGC